MPTLAHPLMKNSVQLRDSPSHSPDQAFPLLLSSGQELRGVGKLTARAQLVRPVATLAAIEMLGNLVDRGGPAHHRKISCQLLSIQRGASSASKTGCSDVSLPCRELLKRFPFQIRGMAHWAGVLISF